MFFLDWKHFHPQGLEKDYFRRRSLKLWWGCSRNTPMLALRVAYLCLSSCIIKPCVFWLLYSPSEWRIKTCFFSPLWEKLSDLSSPTSTAASLKARLRAACFSLQSLFLSHCMEARLYLPTKKQWFKRNSPAWAQRDLKQWSVSRENAVL